MLTFRGGYFFPFSCLRYPYSFIIYCWTNTKMLCMNIFRDFSIRLNNNRILALIRINDIRVKNGSVLSSGCVRKIYAKVKSFHSLLKSFNRICPINFNGRLSHGRLTGHWGAAIQSGCPPNLVVYRSPLPLLWEIKVSIL